jgi:integrase
MVRQGCHLISRTPGRTVGKKAQARNRGQIIPKGEGKYLVRFYNGRGPDGKRLYPSELVEGTYGQAQKALTKLLSSSDTGTFVAPSKLTLKEHCDLWLSGKVNLRAKTRNSYRDQLTNHVYPVLGSVRLPLVSETRISQLWSQMTADGLSPRTVAYTHTILSQALKQAVRVGALLKNPAEFCELPKASGDQHAVVFTPEQASLFLEKTSRVSKWYPLWTVLLSAGLRPQEALALEWSEVDLGSETGTIQVVRALEEFERGKYRVATVKTKKSRRAVSIPQEVVEVLKEHRKTSGRIAGFVFPNDEGSFYTISHVRKAWKQDIKRVNKARLVADELPMPKLYGARHSHATHLLSENVHPKIVQERFGHSSIRITMDTYTHVLPGMDREASDKTGSLLFAKKVASV